jgi:hypothetical protein
VARLVRRATVVLRDAGALSSAGEAVIESLRRTAMLLGPAGNAVLGLLAAI